MPRQEACKITYLKKECPHLKCGIRVSCLCLCFQSLRYGNYNKWMLLFKKKEETPEFGWVGKAFSESVTYQKTV